MKKLLIAIIFTITIMSTNFAFAYSTNYIDFDVPLGYSVKQESNEIDYKSWEISNDDETIDILLYSRDDKGYFEYSEEELTDFVNDMKEGLGSNATLTSKRITSVGGEITYQCYSLNWCIKEYGIYMYLWQYYIVADNYIYILSISSLNDYMSNGAYELLDSIHIKDTITISDNVFDSSMENLLLEFIINLIFTVLMYETVPFILKFIMKKSYSEEEAKKIAIINTVCVFIIITCCYIFILGEGKVANIAPAFLWGSVAFYILKGKQTK